MIPILTTEVRGRSSDWVIIGMCLEGTKVESNVIQVYYTVRNILIKIANKFTIIYQIFNIREYTKFKKN